LSQKHKYKSRKKRKNLFRRIKHKINLYIKEFIESFQSRPTHYRPFLGSQDQDVSTASEDVEITSNDEKIAEDTKSVKIKRRKKRQKRKFSLSEIKKNWEINRSKRKKKKYKKKSKKKHFKKKKRRARIEFIRIFFPNYKKSKNLPLEELKDDKKADQIKQHEKNYFTYTVNSTIVFIIAYLLVYLLNQITILIVASNWKLDSVLLYYDLAFNDYSPLWSRNNILIVTSSGPIICLLVGFLFYRFFSNRKKVKGILKLFFLWIALHSLNLFLGAWATGISFDEGFGYVPAWLYLNVFWQIFVALIFLFLLGTVGFYAAPKFLDTSKSLYRIRSENKGKFLLYQALLPWLIGSIIIILTKIPNNMPYDTANLITMFIAVVPVLFNRSAKPTTSFEKEKKSTKIKWLLVVLFIALILAYRIGLNNGLHIILDYMFDISLDISPL